MNKLIRKIVNSTHFQIGVFLVALSFLLLMLIKGVPGLYEMATRGNSIYSKALKFVAVPVLLILVVYTIVQLKNVSIEMWYFIKKNREKNEDKTRPPSEISMPDKDEEMN